jgi:hypothetical protein
MVKLFNILLARSNSYKYYKSNYELLKNQLKDYNRKNQLEKSFVKLENDIKANNDELMYLKNNTSISLKTIQETQISLEKNFKNIKNEILANRILQNVSSIKKDSNNGRIINIIFLINFRITVMDNLIKLFENDPQFNSNVVIIPYDPYGKNIFQTGLNEHQLKDYEDNYHYFKKIGSNVVKGYDTKLKGFIDINDLNPDLILYSSPWEASFPEDFRMDNLPKNVLFCYIPYGIHASHNEDAQFNQELHKKSWKIFYQTQIHKELAAKYSDVGSSNVVVTGYPKMDPLIDGSHKKSPYSWKDSSHQKKRVIWAPHHSIKYYIHFSTFDENYKFFYEYAKDHSEIEWVFKPHPLLRHYYSVSSQIFPDDDRFSNENLEKYYKAWDNLPNASLYEGGDYLNLFATSDTMITDSVSFLSEYLYSGNPGLFLTNSTQKFNEYGNIIKNAWYQIDGSDFKQIENFINNVVINEDDTLKDVRENIFHKYLKTNGITASNRIYNDIKNNLTYNLGEIS